jgi:hypothetical protein
MPKKIKVVDVASNNEINEDEKPTDNIALPTGKAKIFILYTFYK